MSFQIFKDRIPNEMLIKLLDDIAVKYEKILYLLIINSYKKGMFNNIIELFYYSVYAILSHI